MISIAKPLAYEEEAEAVRKVILSGMMASGDVVHEFEHKFAEFCGAKYGVATTNTKIVNNLFIDPNVVITNDVCSTKGFVGHLMSVTDNGAAVGMMTASFAPDELTEKMKRGC